MEQDCCESHQQRQDPENRAQPINNPMMAETTDTLDETGASSLGGSRSAAQARVDLLTRRNGSPSVLRSLRNGGKPQNTAWWEAVLAQEKGTGGCGGKGRREPH